MSLIQVKADIDYCAYLGDIRKGNSGNSPGDDVSE